MAQQSSNIPTPPTTSFILPMTTEESFLTTEGPTITVEEFVEQETKLQQNIVPIASLTTEGAIPVERKVRFNDPLDAYYFILKDSNLSSRINESFPALSNINTIIRASREISIHAQRFKKHAEEYEQLFMEQQFIISDQF